VEEEALAGTEFFRQQRRQPAVQFQTVDRPAAVEQPFREHAQPRPDFKHDIPGIQRRHALDDIEDIGVDQEVLPQPAVRSDAAPAQPFQWGHHTIFLRAFYKTPAIN
jgi:hypothetical protein